MSAMTHPHCIDAKGSPCSAPLRALYFSPEGKKTTPHRSWHIVTTTGAQGPELKSCVNCFIAERRESVLEIHIHGGPYATGEVRPDGGFDGLASVDKCLGAARHRNSELCGFDHDTSDLGLVAMQEVLGDKVPPNFTHPDWSGNGSNLLGNVDQPGVHDPRPSSGWECSIGSQIFGLTNGAEEPVHCSAAFTFEHGGKMFRAKA